MTFGGDSAGGSTSGRRRRTKRRLIGLAAFLVVGAVLVPILSNASRPLTWPQSPLYAVPPVDTNRPLPATREEAMAAIVGRYAHYDVVSYADRTTRTPMLTFVVSYGFTEFSIEDGRLMQIDRFCRADHRINQPFVTSQFSDAATQAIRPVARAVELEFRDGTWHVYRPATPTLLGIAGDPDLPLSRDAADPNLTDPDGDGKPGVTVNLRIAGVIRGEIYITRREIFQNYLSLHSNGNLYGWIQDDSEQFVVGASMEILRQPSNSLQVADPGMNPLWLVRVDEAMDCAQLAARRDELFPPAPRFVPAPR